MRKFAIYDVVFSNTWIKNIPPNTKGVIMLLYEDVDKYEVEFVDSNNDTIDFLTVSESEIEKNVKDEISDHLAT
jgi:hypothetical protein